jgi:hypothetical protein
LAFIVNDDYPTCSELNSELKFYGVHYNSYAMIYKYDELNKQLENIKTNIEEKL